MLILHRAIWSLGRGGKGGVEEGGKGEARGGGATPYLVDTQAPLIYPENNIRSDGRPRLIQCYGSCFND